MPKLVAANLTPDEFDKLAASKEYPAAAAPAGGSRSGAFAGAARAIYRNPVPSLLFVPALCIALIAFGVTNFEVEENVSRIWSLTSGNYYEDSKYQSSVQDEDTGSSGMLAVAKPRKGSNILTADLLLQVRDRLQDTEAATVEHDGETYTLGDVCFSPLAPYLTPCYRMTPLDCFAEGGYNFDATSAAYWRALVLSGGISSGRTDAVNTFTATAMCPSDDECAARNSVLPDGWGDSDACTSCYEDFLSGTASSQEDVMFYAALKQAGVAAGVETYKETMISMYIATLSGTDAAGIDGCLLGSSHPSSPADGAAGGDCTFDAVGGYLLDSTCQTCFGTELTTGNSGSALSDFQKNYAYYTQMAVVMTASGETMTWDADADAFATTYVEDTVYAYPDATLLAGFQASTDVVAGVATFKQTQLSIYVATLSQADTNSVEGCVIGTSIGMTSAADGAEAAACTYAPTLAFLADVTCTNCIAAALASVSAPDQDLTYYNAVKAQTGLATDAEVDAYALDYVVTAAKPLVNSQLVATALCDSTVSVASGGYGWCDMTGSWSTDADCLACVGGFLAGDAATQSDYLFYAALRSLFTSAGAASTKTAYTFNALTAGASLGGQGTCTASCSGYLGLGADPYYNPADSTNWAYNDATCNTCLATAYGTCTATGTCDTYYYTHMKTILAGVTGGGALTREGDVDTYISTLVGTTVKAMPHAAMDAAFEAEVTSTVNALVGTETPYTFQTGSDPVGQTRPVLTGASDAAVLAAASGTCYWWDEGLALPAVETKLCFGGRSYADAAETTFSGVRAIQTVYSLLRPEAIVERVGMSARPAGAKTITAKDGEAILYKMKVELESIYTAGWDDKGDGDVEFTGFTDDAGAIGTFGRTLTEFTAESAPISVLCYLVTALVCMALLVNPFSSVSSRAGLGLVGTLLAVVAFFGSIGVTVMFDIKLNVVQTWTLPFIMVGLGMDDMFILALAAEEQLARMGAGLAEAAFVEAFVEVGVPIALTSAVNCGAFAIMGTASLPAVYLTAVTAVAAVLLLFLTVMTAFSAAVALDMQRQVAKRRDVLCCLKAAEEGDAAAGEAGRGRENHFKAFLWTRLYEPMLGSLPARVAVLVLTAACLAAAGYGYSQTELGLGLEEFFPPDDQGGRFALRQGQFFPVWPSAVNWGEVAYHEADTQLEMLKQFEGVTSLEAVTSLASTYVWTAGLAEWAAPAAYELSGSGTTAYCASGNALTGGMCGPVVDATCTSTWVENTLDLKLAADGGVCRTGAWLNGKVADASRDAAKEYCPVLDLAAADHARCAALLTNFTNLFAITAPRYNVESDGITPKVPIKWSRGGGSSLFTYDLYTTDDYIKIITEARKPCDDDSSGPHCWVSGIAFDYWEQYLGINEWLLGLSLWGVGIAFVVATLFFYGDFTWGASSPGNERSDSETFLVSIVGGAIVAGVSGLCIYTVVGLSSLFNVNLCGFSAMACLMSAGFAVEYSVHVSHRFMASKAGSAQDRVREAMEGLFLPSTLAFASSAVGIVTLVLSRFQFVRTYFFTPLFIVLFITYFYGAFALPVIFTFLGGSSVTKAAPTEKSTKVASL